MEYTPPPPMRTIEETNELFAAPNSCLSFLFSLALGREPRLTSTASQTVRMGGQDDREAHCEVLPQHAAVAGAAVADLGCSGSPHSGSPSKASPSRACRSQRADQSRPQAFPDKEYIVYEAERLTYADANERILQLASLMHENGVRKGDRVAIAMRNLPEWVIT